MIQPYTYLSARRFDAHHIDLSLKAPYVEVSGLVNVMVNSVLRICCACVRSCKLNGIALLLNSVTFGFLLSTS